MALICDEIEGLDFPDPSPSIEALLGCLEQELEEVVHIFVAERQRRLQ